MTKEVKHDQKQTQKLDEHLKKIQKEKDDLINDLQRVRADFENFRKQVDGRVERSKKSGYDKAVIDFLPVFDLIETSVGNVPEELQDNAWVKGVAATYKKMNKILDKNNIKKIEVKVGEAFNPDLHHAIQMDDEGGSEEIVSEVLQNGYTKNGSVIRHALVKVASR